MNDLSAFCLLSGVGGIEAEAVMLGQAISMVLPEVIGYRITGHLNQLTTSTDVVLTVTKVSLLYLQLLFDGSEIVLNDSVGFDICMS